MSNLISPSMHNGELRILDTDLATRLGFERPRKIRELIVRNLGALEKMGTCPAVGRVVRGNETEVYYLNKKQAIFITAKSETAEATEITIEIIEKFEAYEKGAVSEAAALTKKKSVVHKELSETERRLICEARNIMDDMARAFQSRLDALTLSVMGVTDSYDPTAGFTTEYRPMLAYVKSRAVPSKGRRNIVVSASRHCRAWLRRHGRSSMVRISRESNRHLFHVDGVEMWLRAEGDALIRSHLDHVLGQAALHLPPRHPKPSRLGKVIARSQKKKTELQSA